MGVTKSNYNSSFYDYQEESSLKSAKAVVPIVMHLLNPKSVIDAGCGRGIWLNIFQNNGAKEVCGLDGWWVDTNCLRIKKEEFKVVNLAKSFKSDKKYDLAISLEVAEHLPERSSGSFVKSLSKLSDYVLFSAAIPYQGGTDHINEQWQDYWAKLFKKEGFVSVDFLRRKVWNNPLVEYHYAQNTILYVRKTVLRKNKSVFFEYKQTDLNFINIVHPRKYLAYAVNSKLLVDLSNKFPSFIKKLVKSGLKR